MNAAATAAVFRAMMRRMKSLFFFKLFPLVSVALLAAPAAASAGRLVRGTMPAVYYQAADGKRYVFPNEKTYATWFTGFGQVESVGDAALAAMQIGSNVTVRPGTRMVKIQTDPKVYAVARGGTLRWVKTEAVASALYGADWARKIDDVPDAYFTNYKTGADIAAASDFDPAAETAANATIEADKNIALPPVPMVGTCGIFPADNPWNTDISAYPVHPNSAAYIGTIGAAAHLHPDYGSDPSYGIPITVVGASQPKVPIAFDAYGDESDPGPYPVPANARVEAGSDGHVLVLEKDGCKLYEMFDARKDPSGSGWTAASGAVFDLRSNALRPDTWTSADAAGLPIYPGLVKYDEVASGVIRHALRFTASRTQDGFIHPATHEAGSNDAAYPPMGLRVRLKPSFDVSGYSGGAKVILEAMKKYGMILADNGSNWYFTGETDTRWNDDDMNQLKTVPGSAFEAVDTGPIIK
jgi:hypothetical protein